MSAQQESAGRYVIVWIALLALTATSYALSTAHLGSLDLVVSLVIAVIKSVLVALFFMHLWGDKYANGFALLVAVVFIALLSALTAADVSTRHTYPPALIDTRHDDGRH